MNLDSATGEVRPSTIWVVGRNYPTKQNRMCGSFELAQAKMLASHGHDVTYVSLVFHPLYKAHNWGFWHSYEDGVRIVTLSRFWAPQRMHLYFDCVKESAWRGLLCRVESETGLPDVIHMHYPTLLASPRPLLEYGSRGVEIVATEHWSKVQLRKLDSHESRQLCECVSGSDSFICVGSELRDSVKKITETTKEILTVPNIVSPDFRPAKKSHDGFRFIAVGRLVKVRQLDRVIKTFCESFASGDDVSLEVVGDGPEEMNLRSLAKRLGVGGRVVFAGVLGRGEVAERLSEADCLVCYSSYETFGVPVIEAWATGMPVIASDAIGVKDYWKPGLGLLVSNNDDIALGHAMREMCDDIGKYDRGYISSYAEEHFSEDVVYSRLAQIYKRQVNDAD